MAIVKGVHCCNCDQLDENIGMCKLHKVVVVKIIKIKNDLIYPEYNRFKKCNYLYEEMLTGRENE